MPSQPLPELPSSLGTEAHALNPSLPTNRAHCPSLGSSQSPIVTCQLHGLWVSELLPSFLPPSLPQALTEHLGGAFPSWLYLCPRPEAGEKELYEGGGPPVPISVSFLSRYSELQVCFDHPEFTCPVSANSTLMSLWQITPPLIHTLVEAQA